jgi:HK97 family phage major capsid protein
MATISELRANKTKLLLDAQAILIKPNVTAEERTSAKKMLADVDLIEEQIALEERIAKAQSETRSTGRIPRGEPGEGNVVTDEKRAAEKAAFTDYIKYGIRSKELREQRDLSTSNAGVIIAQDFFSQIVEAQKAWGQLTVSVGQNRTKNGEPQKISLVNDVSSVSTVIGESTTGAEVTVTEQDPAFTGFINNVSFLSTGIIRISLAELEDSYFDLDAWIRTAFGKRIARGLSSLLVTGSTDGNFQSIITTATAGVTSQTAGGTALVYQDFVGMYSKIDPAYLQSASWVMNSTTRGEILGITDTLGRPLFVPSVNTDSLDRILNRPVVVSQSHPNLGSGVVGAVQLGDLPSGFVLRTAGDVSILRLNERYADTGQVGFIGYHRNGSYSTAVAGAPAPILNLTQHV